MSQLLVMRERSWMDGNTERRIWIDLARWYGVSVEFTDTFHGWWLREKCVVLVDERGESALEEFEHPASCLYLFGRTHQNDLIETVPHTHSVRLESQFGRVSLFALCVAPIVLADRERKWQSR